MQLDLAAVYFTEIPGDMLNMPNQGLNTQS